MQIEIIDDLQYAEKGTGPWRIYVYGRDGYHVGGKWFRNGPMKYPDEEIPLHEAMLNAGVAIAHGLEVRICDGGDNLVFHAVAGNILHGQDFWSSLVPAVDAELKAKERA